MISGEQTQVAASVSCEVLKDDEFKRKQKTKKEHCSHYLRMPRVKERAVKMAGTVKKKERFLFWIFLYRAKHRCNSHPPALSISRLSSGMLDVTNWNTDRRQKHIRPSNLYDQNQIRGATCSKNSSCWLVFSVICPLQHRQTNTIAPKKKKKNLFLHSNFPNLAEKYVPIILLFLLCCT